MPTEQEKYDFVCKYLKKHNYLETLDELVLGKEQKKKEADTLASSYEKFYKNRDFNAPFRKLSKNTCRFIPSNMKK